MKSEYKAYGRAVAAVAETRVPYEKAVADLAVAEAVIAEDIARVWDANQAAVTVAKVQVEAAIVNLARVQTEASTSARVRSKDRPLLNADEKAQVAAAEAVRAEADARHAEAKERFKAGVTPEALDSLPEVS